MKSNRPEAMFCEGCGYQIEKYQRASNIIQVKPEQLEEVHEQARSLKNILILIAIIVPIMVVLLYFLTRGN